MSRTNSGSAKLCDRYRIQLRWDGGERWQKTTQIPPLRPIRLRPESRPFVFDAKTLRPAKIGEDLREFFFPAVD